MMYGPLLKNLIICVIPESGARGTHDPFTASAATSYRTKAVAEAYGVKFQKKLNASSISHLRQLPMDTLISHGSASNTIFEGTHFENLTSSLSGTLWSMATSSRTATAKPWSSMPALTSQS